MSTLDAEALATLTPEEQEAIKAADYTPDELAAMQKIADQASGDDAGDDDDSGDDGDDKAGAQPQEGKAPETSDKTEQAAETKADPEPAPDPVAPRYEAKLPSDYGDQIKDLKERDTELRTKFKSGEIGIDERDDGLAEISNQREALLVARAKAEISQEMNQQRSAAQWQNAVNAMITTAAKEDGGIDYRKDADKAADLDYFVKVLANKESNADKSMQWFLNEAHMRVKALHGIASAPTAVTDIDPEAAVAAAVATRKAPVGDAPKTLAQVPGGDGPGDVGDQFADISSLDGWELEQAIGRMSPAMREKFARGG